MHNALTCLQDIKSKSIENPSIASPDLLSLVTRLFLLCADGLDDANRYLFGDVMDRIAFDLGASARADLSRRLACQAAAPHGIIARLAHDDIDIAAPILRHSPCLGEDDLIAIVQQCSREHVRCICERERLSSAVADAILVLDDSGLLPLLLGNDGAELSEDGWGQIQEHISASGELLKLINKRPDRPPALALPKATKAGTSGKPTSRRSTQEIGNPTPEPDQPAGPPDDVITEANLQAAAKSSDLDATVAHLAALAQQDGRLVKHCLTQPEIKALTILCKAEDFADETFAALVQLRLRQRTTQASDVASAIKRYQDLSVDQAKKVMGGRKTPKAAD